MVSIIKKYIFKRPCSECNEIYRPTGKYQKYCEYCKKKIREEAEKKRSLNRE